MSDDPYYSSVMLILEGSLSDRGPLLLPTYTYGNTNVVNNEILFDGNGDCVQSFLPIGFRTSSWTIDFFYKPTNVSALRMLFGQTNPSGVGNINVLSYINSGGSLTVLVYTSGQYSATSTAKLVANKESHIEVSLDRQILSGGSATLRVFIDGVLSASTLVANASLGNPSTAIHFGNVYPTYSSPPSALGSSRGFRVTGAVRNRANFTPPDRFIPLAKPVLISTGVGKSFLFKEESSWGVVPSKTDAVNLRRTNAVFDIITELYTSNEIIGADQIRQVKHGLRNVKGSIKAELSAGTYAKLIANTIASSYSHDVDILDLSIKITQNLTDSTTYDITRQLGSWVVDGFTAGTVVRLDGPMLAVGNRFDNLYICSLTETVLTVYPLNAVELTIQSTWVYPNRCYTIGAIAYAKKAEQVDKSFSFEERDHRLGISELYSGNKVKAFEVNTEVKSGLPTIDFELLGRDLVRKESTQYFDDTSYSTTQVVSPVCTKAFIDNSMIGVMTGFTLRVERELQPNHTVGSKQSVAISESMLNVSGSFTVYFKDASLKQRYYNETTCSLTVVFADSLAKDAQVISFCLPKVILKSKRKNDNAGMLYDTYEFTAVLNNDNNQYLKTTISIQDSEVEGE